MTRDRLDLLRECDHLTMEGLRRHGLYDEIWQCPTAMVPLSINGKGKELIVLRPVSHEESNDCPPGTAAQVAYRGAAGFCARL